MKNLLRTFLSGARKIPEVEGDEARRFVLILGMHRSGTSCLTGMFEKSGLYLGDVTQRDKFNKKGNRESKLIQKINNDLLSLSGGSWTRPRKAVRITDEIKERIQEVLDEMDGYERIWGIKDPRMVLCYEAWIGPSTMLVGTIRHPYNVARSLEKRSVTISFEEGQRLWFLYNRELLALYRRRPFPIVDFDWEPARYRAVVEKIALSLGLEKKDGGFFEESLKHNTYTGEIENPEYRRLYEELTSIAGAEAEKL